MVSRRQLGISLMEVVLVASAITLVSATSFTMVEGIARNAKVDEAKMILSRYRAGIRLYRWRKGSFPLALWSTYTYRMNGTAAFSASIYGSGFGPPKDPFKGSTTVTYGTAVTGVGGWLYDTASGRIWINLLDSEYGTAGSVMKLPENPSTW